MCALDFLQIISHISFEESKEKTICILKLSKITRKNTSEILKTKLLVLNCSFTEKCMDKILY